MRATCSKTSVTTAATCSSTYVDLPLDPFRISYAYTNFGLTAGAEAVAVSAGKSWEDLSRRRAVQAARNVLDELPLRRLRRQAEPRARPHPRRRQVRAAATCAIRRPEAPAGGASSSVNDMTHWLAMMLADGTYEGKQIVDPKALLPALTPQIVSSPASEPAMRTGFYGYGFNVGTTSAARMELSHSGAFELGSGTNFVILPSADVAIVALTNATPGGLPETLTAEFADLVQFGEVREDWYKLYTDAFKPMGEPSGLAGRPAAAGESRGRRAVVDLRRDLRQRLLGSGAGQ